MPGKHLVRVGKTADQLSQQIGTFIAEHSAAAIKARGRFSIGFSGGSLPKLACGAIATDSSIEWAKWDVFFVDERCVPLDHDDSNFKSLKEHLLDKLSTPMPPTNIVAYDATSPTPEAAAQRYADALTAKVQPASPNTPPAFDLLLLGMGEDGHTASLFPGHALLEERTALVAHILDSPKPPPQRITLTYPVIGAAREVAVVAAGGGKADLLSQILDKGHEGPEYPVERAGSREGTLKWFIDEPAAAKLDLAAMPTF